MAHRASTSGLPDERASAFRPVARTQPDGDGARITFGVLGPLAVWRDGAPVPLPSGTCRRILAALLLADGDPVTPERLAALAREPGAALAEGGRSWSQVAVCRLRGWLSRVTGNVVTLEFHTFGYRLRLDSAETDLGLFRQWYSDAQRQRDPAARAVLAGRAVALWRGEPFIDATDSLRADPAVTALNRLLLDAACLLASAALTAGTPRDALPYLAELAERHPLDERLQGATARLLAADGRQAEALQLIEDTTGRLADELGVDPGAYLRDAQLQILRQQPAGPPVASGGEPGPFSAGSGDAGAVADPPAGAIRWLGPRSRITQLVARSADQAGVANLLRSRRLVTVAGAGGVGKTALALHIATRLGAQYPDGVAVLALAAVSSLDQLQESLLTLLGGAPTVSIAGIDGRLGELTRDLRLLLVLDNCEHVLGPAGEFVQFLRAVAPGITVLATSRHVLGVADEAVWPLAGLPVPVAGGAVEPESGAVALFLARARDAGLPPVTTQAELADVARLCRKLDGVPLAVELAAGMARVLSPGELLGQVSGSPGLLLTGAEFAEPRHRSLESCMEWSYRLLGREARTLLCRLSAAGGPFTVAVAEAVSGSGPASVSAIPALVTLVNHHLVTVQESGGGSRRFVLPYAVQRFARRRLATSGEQAAVYDRLLDHWLRAGAQSGEDGPLPPAS